MNFEEENLIHFNESPTPKAAPKRTDSIDPQLFSTVLVSVKVNFEQTISNQSDPHTRLMELMNSAAIRALIDAAELHASRQRLSKEKAVHEIIQSFKELDHRWNQVLLVEGLAHLSSN